MAEAVRRKHRLQVFGRKHPVTGGWEMQRPPALDDTAREALPEFGTNTGLARTIVYCDPQGADGDGLSLIWLRFGSNYQLPRHSHSTPCLYYILAGEVHMGSRVLGSGEGFYVDADTPYGYTVGPAGVELLEFRAHTWFDSRIHETRSGWERALAAMRANRVQWETELADYR
jgi:hypothetical protein